MEQEENSVWIANHPFLDCALFFRQKVHRVLLMSRVKALINIVGASMWISETDGTDSAPGLGERIPDRYTEAVLYHLRHDHLIGKEEILGFQGLQDGDVLVLIRGDQGLQEMQARLLRQTGHFPVCIPGGLVRGSTLLSGREVLEVIKGYRAEGNGTHPGPLTVEDVHPREEGTRALGEASPLSRWCGSEEGVSGAPDMPPGGVDLYELAEELRKLRGALENGAEGRDSVPDAALVALAEIAARAGAGGKAVECLRRAGEDAIGTASRIGAGLAVRLMGKRP